jgi:hypothetical protein
MKMHTFQIKNMAISHNLLKIIICWRIHRRKKEQQLQKRRWWVHPIHSERKKKGTFKLLIPRLLEDSDKFFNFFRMDRNCFESLLKIVGPRFIIGILDEFNIDHIKSLEYQNIRNVNRLVLVNV